MTKAIGSHISQLNDIDHMWNVALDNYEDEGNDGQKSLVGDESDHKRWLFPYTLKKLGVSKPNIILTFFFWNNYNVSRAIFDLGVMLEFVTNARMHG